MNNKIKTIELWALSCIIVLSSFIQICFNLLINTSKNDILISIIISSLLTVPIYIIFKTIFNYRESLPINEKIKLLFGKKISLIINNILIIIFLITAICHLYSLTFFINSLYLAKTPPYLIALALTILFIYANIKGLKTISRIAFLLLLFNLLLFLIPIINIIPKSIDNFKPILKNGTNPIKGSLYIIILSINNIFLLTVIPKKIFIKKEKALKMISLSLILSLIIIFLIALITIGNLGIELSQYYKYPMHIVLKRVNLFNFLNRAEYILLIALINGSFITICFIIFYITKTIKKDNKISITLLSSLILLGSLYHFKNNIDYINFIKNKLVFLNTITLIFFILIALMVKKKDIK